MIHVKTSAGFEEDIDESCLDDMELFDAVTDLESGRVTALSVITDKILGPQKKALYDALRDKNGRAPIKAVSDAVTEILEQLGGKN